MLKNKGFDVVRLAAKRGEAEGQTVRDIMAAHEMSAFMTKKSNPKAILSEKLSSLVSPASHFSRFSPIVTYG